MDNGQSMEENLSQSFTIKNKLGLHARAAALFVQLSNKLSSEILVEKNGQEVNGKSIMGILILAATQGSRITVKTEGQDAKAAMDALGGLIDNGFGED